MWKMKKLQIMKILRLIRNKFQFQQQSPENMQHWGGKGGGGGREKVVLNIGYLRMSYYISLQYMLY